MWELAEEREVLAVQALVALGRYDEAAAHFATALAIHERLQGMRPLHFKVAALIAVAVDVNGGMLP